MGSNVVALWGQVVYIAFLQLSRLALDDLNNVKNKKYKKRGERRLRNETFSNYGLELAPLFTKNKNPIKSNLEPLSTALLCSSNGYYYVTCH